MKVCLILFLLRSILLIIKLINFSLNLGVGNVTIRVIDVNDNPPHFEHSKYKVEVPETMQRFSAVMTLLARDLDNEAM